MTPFISTGLALLGRISFCQSKAPLVVFSALIFKSSPQINKRSLLTKGLEENPVFMSFSQTNVPVCALTAYTLPLTLKPGTLYHPPMYTIPFTTVGDDCSNETPVL